MIATLALLAALPSCDGPSASSVPSPPAPAAPSEAARSAEALPRCASKADVERLHGQTVRVEALYDVDPSPAGKGLEAAYLLLDDGTALVRSYRPVVDELGFVERRVIAVGKVYRDAGQADHIQQLMAPHFYPDRIELAPGEAKITPPPTERPAPAKAERVADLAGRKLRWAQVTGTLEALTPKEDTAWSEGRLKLASGEAVALSSLYTIHWKELVGTEITVVGKVIATGEKAGEAATIVERTHCKGRVERCSK